MKKSDTELTVSDFCLINDFIGVNNTFIIVKDNSFFATLHQGQCTANKSVAVFLVKDGLGTDNSIAWLTLAVKTVAWSYDLGAMVMPVKEQIRLDIVAHQLCPFSIELLLDIKGMFIDVRKGNM